MEFWRGTGILVRSRDAKWKSGNITQPPLATFNYVRDTPNWAGHTSKPVANVGSFERKTNDKLRREYRRQADTQALRRHHLQCARIRGIRCVDCDALRPFQEARCWIASQGENQSADHLHPASVSGSSVLDIFEHDSLGITALTVGTIFPEGLM